MVSESQQRRYRRLFADEISRLAGDIAAHVAGHYGSDREEGDLRHRTPVCFKKKKPRESMQKNV